MSDEQEKFDKALQSILDGMTGTQLLVIPGLYEVVSEYLNNDVLQLLKDTEEDDT